MFNPPMSLQRADHLIKVLDLSASSKVVDLGCGDGALLRRIAVQHHIIGVGVDNDESLIQQANDLWAGQSTNSELTFVCADASTYFQDVSPVDVIMCIGGEFIFGGYRELLQHAKSHLNADGKLLIGTIYWKQSPSAEYLELMGGENPHFDLPTTVQMAHDEGFMPMDIGRSNDDEWDAFESGHTRKRYLRAIRDNQPDLIERAWQWQQGYVRWGMTTMGFCFLVLQKV